MGRYYAHITGAANIEVPVNPGQIYTNNSNHLTLEFNGDNLQTNGSRNNGAVWIRTSGNWFSFEMYSEGWEYLNLGSTTYIGRYNYWSTDGFEETFVIDINNGNVTLTKGEQTSATTFNGGITASDMHFFRTGSGTNVLMNFYRLAIYGGNSKTLLYDFVPDYEGTTKGMRDKVSGNFYAATDQSKISLVSLSVFEITPTETATTYESGATTVTVNTDNDTSVTWTASTTDSWLSLSPTTGAGDGSVTITYAGNSTYSPRTGVVTFTSSEGETLTFTLEQERKPVVVYDRPIYRSGSLVKKMYRSGEMIYLRLNPPTE